MLTLGAWFSQVGVILLNAFVLYHFLRLDGLFKDWINYIVMSLYLQIGAPINYNPRNRIVRCVYGTNLVVGFMWNAIFCALWISSLSKMFDEVRIRSISEAVAEGYHFAGNECFNEVLENTSILCI